MGETANRKFPYPEPEASPDVPRDMKALADAVDSDMAFLLPVGIILAYGGTTTPPGWLLCDGQPFNEATYPLLRQVLGAAATPNLLDRFIKGAGTRPATPTGGTRTVPLPQHSHGGAVHSANASHSHAGATTTNGRHSHGLPLNQRNGTFAAGGSSAYSVYVSGGFTTHESDDHAHYLSTDTQHASHTHGLEIHNNGTAGAEMEPPFYALLYIVKAL